jgi:hypothetical protein
VYSDHLRPSDWEVVVRAPGNFFLAGEHAVMFGHPAVCQALPAYTYVGLRRRLDDAAVNLDLDAVSFFDVMKPGMFRHDFEYPARFVACQLERLLESDGWKGVDIGLYSELPSMCGLASSGALASALAIGLNIMFEKTQAERRFSALRNSFGRPRDDSVRRSRTASSVGFSSRKRGVSIRCSTTTRAPGRMLSSRWLDLPTDCLRSTASYSRGRVT